MDSQMVRMTEEEKENKKMSVRVNSCCSCIHPSKPATSQFYGAARSLVTLRHPGLHVIPYAAMVRIYKGTRADACCSYSNIGREPAVSQPLTESPWSAEDHANCINPSFAHNLVSV
ncbi:unnamed protein product [Fusarium venenatum]|uniref:Uncharacterized protein n=1 Tax=Fusarium venenatum TaxID=56646 RepID=A0A2L2T7M6_9HYPO|nr:uncharacterized protein FVRRES_05607 [Fusarium venenatum]CEI61171.1 unnamed protein product [Fusarium venenatum]